MDIYRIEKCSTEMFFAGKIKETDKYRISIRKEQDICRIKSIKKQTFMGGVPNSGIKKKCTNMGFYI